MNASAWFGFAHQPTLSTSIELGISNNEVKTRKIKLNNKNSVFCLSLKSQK